MDSSQNRQQEIYRVQQEILAYLNAKPDNRAVSKELISNINCRADIFCESIRGLNAGGFIVGPEFTEEMVAESGNNNFRHSTQMTGAGQEKYIGMIREEQSE
ncbi:MAG: hypothetical protein V1739_02960 [Candidatus Omnitrophota bacterium]